MSQVLPSSSRVVHRRVLEIRYSFGQLYLDRCGQITQKLLMEDFDWDSDGITTDQCQLKAKENSLVFAFGPNAMMLQQVQNRDVEEIMDAVAFSKLAESCTKLVSRYLQLENYTRIGYRVWYFYGTDNRQASHDAATNLAIMSSVPSELGSLEDNGFTLNLSRSTHSVKVSVGSFEQQITLPASVVERSRRKAKTFSQKQHEILLDSLKAKKCIKSYPQFGISVDFDASLDYPELPDTPTVTNFVATAEEDFAKISPVVMKSKSNELKKRS